MTTKRYSPECMDRHFVALGKEGEGNHLALRFDTAVWREAYPEAEILLWVTPPVGEGYFAELAEQSGDVIWTVTSGDTEHKGEGEIELILRDKATRTTIKSSTARTIIKCSPSAREAAGDPPAPHVPWWQRVLDALVGVVRSVNGVKPGPDGNIVISGVGSEGSVGAPGEDGGFYTPSVSRDGVLSWEASKAGMPDVPDANIKGPDGEPGKDANITTENIAKALGYTPAKQEDVRSLSEHKANRGGWTADKFLGTDASGNMVTKDAPPGGYTLPIASTDTLGGVKVGNGLRMDGDVLGVKPEGVEEQIAKITTNGEEVFVVDEMPNGDPLRLDACFVDLDASADKGAAIWVKYFYNENEFSENTVSTSESNAYTASRIEKKYGRWETYQLASGSDGRYGTTYIARIKDFDKASVEKNPVITKIWIKNNKKSIGAIITVRGVQTNA